MHQFANVFQYRSLSLGYITTYHYDPEKSLCRNYLITAVSANTYRGPLRCGLRSPDSLPLFLAPGVKSGGMFMLGRSPSDGIAMRCLSVRTQEAECSLPLKVTPLESTHHVTDVFCFQMIQPERYDEYLGWDGK